MNSSELAETNLKLAYKTAWNFYKKINCSIDIEELQSVCLLALVKASSTFDITKQVEFSTYACTLMRNDLVQYITKTYKSKNEVSIQAKLAEDCTLEDMLQDSTNLDELISRKLITEKLRNYILELDEIEQTILIYYLDNYTLKQISLMLNMKYSKIQTLYNKALNKLRYKFFSRGEVNY